MIKATAAVEGQTYTRLHGAVTGAAVFQDVPDNQPLPVVIIGDMLSVPFAGADDPDRRITLTIVVLVEGDERGPCTDIQEEIEDLLAGVTLKTTDWNLHYSVASSAAELAEDGSGYVGTTILTILAFSNG